MDRITVLLVDDHSVVRRGFRRMLEDDPELAVVGEASDGDEAVRLALRLRPRVVVMDCAMPGMNGLVATQRILEARPDVAILMLSMHSEETLVRQALDAGARGYVLKNAIDLDLAAAVKRVAAGETVLDPRSRRRPRSRASATRPERARTRGAAADLQGQSNREIAARLGLSVNTVACTAPTSWTRWASTRRPNSWCTRFATAWSDPCEPPRVPPSREPGALCGHAWPAWPDAALRATRDAPRGRHGGPPAFSSGTTTAPTAASSCPRRWARAARFSTTTPTAGRTSCSSTAWTGRGTRTSARRCASIATTATARSPTSRAPPVSTSRCTAWASPSATTTTTAFPTSARHLRRTEPPVSQHRQGHVRRRHASRAASAGARRSARRRCGSTSIATACSICSSATT